jgi:hypothetical protein
MPRVVQMFNTTTTDGQPIQVYQTDDGRYLHSDVAQQEIAAGRLVAQKSDYPAQSSVQGIKMPVKTASEEVHARLYNQGATQQANLPAAQGIAQKYDYSPAAFQTTLKQAGVADTREGQEAYKKYVEPIKPASEDIQRRMNFEFGPVTEVVQQHIQGVPQTPFEKTAMSLGQEAVSGMPEREVLGRPMEKTEADFAKAREASMQQAEKPAKVPEGVANVQVYDINTDPGRYEIARMLATGELNYSQAIQTYPAFGKKGQIRENILLTAKRINPKFSPSEQMIAYGAKGTGEKARATLAPDIMGGKVEQQARGRAAGTLLLQKEAAVRGVKTFDHSRDPKTGKFKDVNDPIYKDLMLDYAKVLVANGTVGVEILNEVTQQSAKGTIVNMWNALTGDTKTTAPQKVLELMYNRMSMLRDVLVQQYKEQTNRGTTGIPRFAAPSGANAHPQASQAEQWARQHPNDPRAKTILQRLGAQ